MKELFENYYKDLHRMAYSYTRNEFDADDLTQDTAERIIREWDRFNGSNFLGWARTIMRNIWINWRKREQFYSDNELPEIPDADKIERLDIDLLPKELRSCISLILDGWKYKEIGKILGIPEGTVKSRVSKAKEILRLKYTV